MAERLPLILWLLVYLTVNTAIPQWVGCCSCCWKMIVSWCIYSAHVQPSRLTMHKVMKVSGPDMHV